MYAPIHMNDISFLSAETVLCLLEKLSQQPLLRMIRRIFQLLDISANMYVTFSSVLGFSHTLNKMEYYELYFVVIRYLKYVYIDVCA